MTDNRNKLAISRVVIGDRKNEKIHFELVAKRFVPCGAFGF